TYGAAGTYAATLTVTDTHGAASSDTAVATVTMTAAGGGQFLWNQHVLAATAFDSSLFGSVAFDSSGNLVAIGTVWGSVNWGEGWVTYGRNDVFLAKYSPTGALIWAHRLPQDGDAGIGVAVDGNGNIFVTGGFSGTLDLGGGPLVAVSFGDIFVAKYSP